MNLKVNGANGSEVRGQQRKMRLQGGQVPDHAGL